jgi:hypothetical protein
MGGQFSRLGLVFVESQKLSWVLVLVWVAWVKGVQKSRMAIHIV